MTRIPGAAATSVVTENGALSSGFWYVEPEVVDQLFDADGIGRRQRALVQEAPDVRVRRGVDVDRERRQGIVADAAKLVLVDLVVGFGVERGRHRTCHRHRRHSFVNDAGAAGVRLACWRTSRRPLASPPSLSRFPAVQRLRVSRNGFSPVPPTVTLVVRFTKPSERRPRRRSCRRGTLSKRNSPLLLGRRGALDALAGAKRDRGAGNDAAAAVDDDASDDSDLLDWRCGAGLLRKKRQQADHEGRREHTHGDNLRVAVKRRAGAATDGRVARSTQTQCPIKSGVRLVPDPTGNRRKSGGSHF